VCVCSRSEARVSEAVKGLQADLKRKGGGGTVKGTAANVAKPADVAQLGRFAVQQFGGIDLWINNAGSNAYRYFVCRASTVLLDTRLPSWKCYPFRVSAGILLCPATFPLRRTTSRTSSALWKPTHLAQCCAVERCAPALPRHAERRDLADHSVPDGRLSFAIAGDSDNAGPADWRPRLSDGRCASVSLSHFVCAAVWRCACNPLASGRHMQALVQMAAPHRALQHTAAPNVDWHSFRRASALS
jgi:hypothetical protein